MRLVLQATARRISDRKKMAQMMPIADELLENGQPTDLPIWQKIAEKIHGEFKKLAQSPYEITRFVVAEQQEVTETLSQEDFDSDPQWKEWGYKPGDAYTDFIYFGSEELDKNLLANHN